MGTRPIGILYHTSESDIWPLEEDFNEKLRDSSQRLLSYLRREHVYNYLVDRFGRVYRVVDDESRANHAGFSIWQHGSRIYLNLNSSFLAVSFETRWEGGRALPITEAQLAAGRSLSDWLRYRLEDRTARCALVTAWSASTRRSTSSAITSTGPADSPSTAFGLPDQYATPPASITLFGFSYDESLVATMGEPWPGVRDAESSLGEQAVKDGVSLNELRRKTAQALRPVARVRARRSEEGGGRPPRRDACQTTQEDGGRVDLMNDDRNHLWKVAEDAQERVESLVTSTSHPMGVDVGTSKIVATRRMGKELQAATQINAFIPVPYSPVTERTLQSQPDISYFRDGDELVIFGSATERLANLFNVESRRPMADGLLNPREHAAMPVLEAILETMVPKARNVDESLAFSVPAAVPGREAELTYHEATLRRFFQGLGYKPVPLNEGLAVVFAELERENFTGIGISFGGGMCNAALGVPLHPVHPRGHSRRAGTSSIAP